YHPVDPFDHPYQDLRVAAVSDPAAQRHDAVGHADDDAGGVRPQHAFQNLLAYLLGDVVVAAQEDLEQVTPADDPPQPSLGVDDGQPLHPLFVHQAGGVDHAG